jgi:tRNA dimethylallyltransferase
MAKRYSKKVLVIVGPTGSGKTGLAIEMAKRVGGEVISADSRAIYKYMDIGTAKPTVEEMDGVPHWGIDLVEPGERFTAADFKEYALNKINEIRERGHVPIIAGGTGLYVDAVIYDYHFDDNVKKTCSDRTEVGDEFLIFGIEWDRETLRERITARADKMFEQDIVGETEMLARKYGWGSQAMKSNIYPIVQRMKDKEINLEEAKQLFIYEDMYLAKRQMTWFRRNKKIVWVGLDGAAEHIYNVFNGQR